MFHTVIQVKPTTDFTIYVYFDDGTIKLYDARPIVGKGVFSVLTDPLVFMNTCTVMNNTLAWDLDGSFDEEKCLDIDPETLYRDGKNVADPLAQDVA